MLGDLQGIQQTALAGLEVVINKALDYDPAAQNAIESLDGKVLAVTSTMPPMGFCILHRGKRLDLMAHFEGQPDTTLTGSASALAMLAVTADRRTTFAGSGVTVDGDQTLLSDIQAILKSLDIDWETALAQLIGDIPAHFIGSTVRSTTDWGKTASTRASRAAREFTQEEAQLTPTAAESKKFNADVRKLRADTDRLQARFQQLEKQLENPETSQEPN
ncbi:MAG: ubiquinone biosynthesis accessory factor UbiJ [bacterium]